MKFHKIELASFLFNTCITLIGMGLQNMEHNIPGMVFIIIGCTGIFLTTIYWIYSSIKSKMRKKFNQEQQKDNIKTKKESPIQKSREYDILDDCKWEEFPGWFINPKTKEKFCYDCWQPPRRFKQYLKKKSLSEWFCPECKRLYVSQLTMWKNLAGVK